MIQHQGGCHCGRVRFEVLAPAVINVSQCNCSICSKSGYIGMIVPQDRFTLLSGEESLTEYRFDSGVAKHLFCKFCGIKSFYIPRSHPDGGFISGRGLIAGFLSVDWIALTVESPRFRGAVASGAVRHLVSGRRFAVFAARRRGRPVTGFCRRNRFHIRR